MLGFILQPNLPLQNPILCVGDSLPSAQADATRTEGCPSGRDIYGQALNVPTIALRFQNVYGPGQSLRNLYTCIISIFSNQMRQNIPIDIYEDGQETRDFIFVEDVAAICARALSLECETLLINVGSGVATPVIALAQNLKHLWQSDSDIQITGNFRVGDIRHNWADLTALHQVFPDWQPTSLAAGLESFVT
jgi:dTDP-L-rhamnose 4-epimerase